MPFMYLCKKYIVVGFYKDVFDAEFVIATAFGMRAVAALSFGMYSGSDDDS
jgi:hypothetical protein